MLKLLIYSLGLLLLTSGLSYAGEPMAKAKQTAQTLNKRVTKRVKVDYLLFLPQGYKAKSKERWPLIFFLHGIGERGSDPWKVKTHGPPKMAEKITNFPFVVVSPQCPDGEWWSSETLMTLLDDVIKNHSID